MNNNYVKVKIEGKNINNYIKWIIKKNINIIRLNIINHNLLEIIIDYKDYKIISKYSKTYKTEIIEKYGKIKLYEIIKKNIPILLSVFIAILTINILSNMIFSIEIIYNNKEIAEIINSELKKYDIKKYKRKKNYNELNKIKSKILKDNKDILEWIEIEEYGTKYIIKFVERKQEKNIEQFQYQSIVAKKNAIIKSIRALSGEKIKNTNEYVKKGEVIINGIITKPDNEQILVKGEGNVYGEVWYKVDIEYPLYYKEENFTGKSKEVLTINFLNKKINIFPYKKYKQFKAKSKILFNNNIIPVEIIKDKLYESNIKEHIYTQEEALEKAILESKMKILENNKNIKEIKKIYILRKESLNSKIKLSLFVSVIEDITQVQKIEKTNFEKEKINNY